MGLIKGILIYKYARRRANKKRDRQESLAGRWDEEICDDCGRTHEEHHDDEEPGS